jgi:hypothetical protein
VSTISPDDLVDQYREEAIKQARVVEGSVREFNKCSGRMHKIWLKLRALGRENDLLRLLDDPHPWVQLCAAGNTLELAETEAMELLRRLATAADPWLSLTAQTTILAWNSGTWGRHDGTCPSINEAEQPRDDDSHSAEGMDPAETVEKVRKLLAKVKKIPTTVRFTDIQQCETMEDRFFAVDRTIGSIVGMNVDSVDFCPDNEPPSRDEVLAWLWIIHPEYKGGIWELAGSEVRTAIRESETE